MVTGATLKIPLGDGWFIIAEKVGAHSKLLLSFENMEQVVTERLEAFLSPRQSIQLASFLAGVTVKTPIPGFAGDDEDEDTQP